MDDAKKPNPGSLRNCYVFTHSPEIGVSAFVQLMLNGVPNVVNWLQFLPCTYVLVADCGASELFNSINEFSDAERFIILNVNSGERNGWLPKAAWDMMATPRAVWEPHLPQLPLINKQLLPL